MKNRGDFQMRVIIKEVGKEPRVEDIENELSTLQKLVGGYIEAVSTGQGICLVCNEEGKLNGLPANFPIGNDVIAGTAVFVAYGNDGNFADLSDEQIEILTNFFNEVKKQMEKAEKLTVVEIAKRAEEMDLLMFDRMSLIMDIENVHAEIGLKLNELLKADDLNFAHDIVGIQQNIDRQSKKLQNLFLPRYAKGEN